MPAHRHREPAERSTPVRVASEPSPLAPVVHQHSAHCTPSDAVNVLETIGGVGQPEWPITIRVAPLRFAYKGSYQWLWVKRPGIFTVNTSPDVDYEVYAVDDFMFPLEQASNLNLDYLPPQIRRVYREGKVRPDGSTYLTQAPFFVALRTRNGATGRRAATLAASISRRQQSFSSPWNRYSAR